MSLNEAAKNARPGQYIRCDVFGKVLSVVDRLTNGLGTIYQVKRDGTVSRVAY